MEIELRQGPVAGELGAGHLEDQPARQVQGDRPVLSAVKGGCRDTFHKGDGGGDVACEVLQTGLALGHAGTRNPGQLGHRIRGLETGEPHLGRERKHVRRQAAIDQHRRVERLVLGQRRALVDLGRQAFQHLGEGRDGQGVEGHGRGS